MLKRRATALREASLSPTVLACDTAMLAAPAGSGSWRLGLTVVIHHSWTTSTTSTISTT